MTFRLQSKGIPIRKAIFLPFFSEPLQLVHCEVFVRPQLKPKNTRFFTHRAQFGQ